MDPLFIDISADGIFATHPERAEFPVKVATTTSDDLTKHNTLRPGLITIACWSIPDAHFDFDSSVIRPEVKGGVVKFAQLRQRLTDAKTGERPPISIFGHADPVGTDDYNKTLSGRRAQAMYGLLTKNTQIWEQLYEQPFGGDNWQNGAVSSMRRALPPKTVPATAKHMDVFHAYMDFLSDLQLTTGDFLARGADPDGKGDYQGCGKCNPVFLLSQKEEKEFANLTTDRKRRRDKLNLPNRRVLAFLFKPGSRADSSKWPCPSVKEKVSGCQSRFWIDGEQRRTNRLPNAHREYQKVATDLDTDTEVGTGPEETFGCRFYYGISLHSPCEGGLKIWPLRILLSPTKAGEDPKPLAKARFVVKAGEDDNAPLVRGETTDTGELFVPVFDEQTKMSLKLDVSAANTSSETGAMLFMSGTKSTDTAQVSDPNAFPGEESFATYLLDAGALRDPNLKSGGPDAVKQRLYNLGYGPANFNDWDSDPSQTPSDSQLALQQFQQDQGLQDDDPDFAEKTRQALVDTHGS